MTGKLSCRRCGYDLAGLPGDARCPECGLAAAHARLADELATVMPHRLRAARVGCVLLAAGLLLAAPVLAVVLGKHLAAVLDLAGDPDAAD